MTDKYERKNKDMIVEVIMYPFRGTGKYMLVIGGLFSLVLAVLSFAPLFGIVVIIFSSGFFASYLFDIVGSSAMGKDEPCDWPDVRDFWSDIVGPWFCMVSTTWFSFGPLLLVGFLSEPSPFIMFPLFILGFFHFPMAVLSVAVYRRALAAFWVNTILAILRCLPQYFALVVILGIIALINTLFNTILLKIPILGWFISFFLWMYVFMIYGRILGLFYRDNSTIFNNK